MDNQSPMAELAAAFFPQHHIVRVSPPLLLLEGRDDGHRLLAQEEPLDVGGRPVGRGRDWTERTGDRIDDHPDGEMEITAWTMKPAGPAVVVGGASATVPDPAALGTLEIEGQDAGEEGIAGGTVGEHNA